MVDLKNIDETSFSREGDEILGPDGEPFARVAKIGNGLVNYGNTTIEEFVRDHRARFPDLSPSMLNVMEAVSVNEGKLEAINTYDNSFMTFGIFQWTAGKGDGRGELPALLALLKHLKPGSFARHFSDHGLDVQDVDIRGSDVARGVFNLDGESLVDAHKKERLRTKTWAYRFWNAGHDDEVREVQIRHAITRLQAFYFTPLMVLDGRSIS